MSVSTYVPDSTKILHIAYADFVSRQIGRTVHVVQYDDSLPLLAVKLFSDGQPYTIPSNANISIKLGKSDGKFVYNPALGCDSTRHIAYFEITYQMVVLAETVSPVIEVRIGSSIAASSSIGIIIDRNPIQRDDIESTSEWKVIQQAIDSAKNVIDYEVKAAASRSAAAVSEQNAKTSETNAKTSENNAKDSEAKAKSSETNAANSELEARRQANASDLYSTLSRSYAVGDTDYREGEATNNAKYYYEQTKNISLGLSGAFIPMGTITFAELQNQTKVTGYTYNISDDFMSDDTFKDGSGIRYPCGTNVYYTADGYWDCLAGSLLSGIKGDAETDFRQGYVNITPDDIGSYNKETVDNMISALNNIINMLIDRVVELEDLSGFAHLVVDDSGSELVTSDNHTIILSI